MRRILPILVALTILAGCGAASSATPAPTSLSGTAPANAPTARPTIDPAAKAQPLRVMCSGAPDWCTAMLGTFQATTGISTTYEQASSGASLDRLRAAAAEFDVWHAGPIDGYMVAQSEQLLQPYISPAASQIPAQLRDKDGYWTGTYIGVLSFCSNPAQLQTLGVARPQSWQDLLNPKLKGQVAMGHPATSGTAYNAVWAQVTLNGGEVEGALDYFKQLQPNIARFTRSGPTPAEMASRSEVAVGIVFQHDCVRTAENSGVALEASFPSEGTGYEIGGVAMVKGAPHEAAARAYIDWALSAESQEIPPTIKSYQLPTNPGARIAPAAQAGTEIKQVDFDFAAAAAARAQITERFLAEIAPAPEN